MKATDKNYAASLFVAALICIAGWDLFYFLTDDAFIAFRYISQRQLGHGYTWNAPPWAPVEGYTSFAWVFLLDIVWTLTGIKPPDSANPISLLCSLGSLLIFAHWARHLIENHHPDKRSPGFFAICLGGLVTHRIFLTWTSSGLETALFNLLIIAWTWFAFQIHKNERRHRWCLASIASTVALTRPDGYLFVAATVGILSLHGWKRGLRIQDLLFGASPLLVVGAHLIWRRSFYGEWLPNTYYAKVVGPLPDLGLGYLLSFALEHVIWLWVFLIAAALFRSKIWREIRFAGPRAIAIGTLTAHLVFYTIIAGGDHFEYRVISHLVPLSLLTLIWAVFKVANTPRMASLLLAFTLLISSVIPWLHWSVSQEYERWAPTMPAYPIAQELPDIISDYGQIFDDLQQWLFAHGVGMRHQQHKLFYEHQRKWVPSRSDGPELMGDEVNPTVLTSGAGVTGWSFPNAHIIDFYGLNDYVVARTRPYEQNIRVIAHARRPPPGYVEELRPNMTVTPTQVTDFVPRSPAMTDDDLRNIEAKYRAQLPKDRNLPKVYKAPGN